MGRLKYLMVALLMVLPLMVVGGAQAVDTTDTKRKKVNGVSITYTTIYSTSTCQRTRVFKMKSYTFRFKRDTFRHSAKIIQAKAAQQLSRTCSGRAASPGTFAVDVARGTVCWGCRGPDAKRSDQYGSAALGWPYLLPADLLYIGSYVRFSASFLRSTGGNTTKRRCFASAIYGGPVC